MTAHAKDPLGCLRVAQIFDFSFAVPASKASGAEGLFSGQDREIFDLIAAGTAAVRAIIAY
jgi:hypothetical protein